MPAQLPFVVRFDEIDKDDIALVGGKGANLGEMAKEGFNVPGGFIVTSSAYYQFLDQNKLRGKIKGLIKSGDLSDPRELSRISRDIRRMINHHPVPPDLAKLVISRYFKLEKNALVAVRSSATAEDLPDASFAGQQETFLNVYGEANLMEKIRDSWSSLFTPRAIFYRQQKRFDHFQVGIAVAVQKMVQAEISGVMFTINPVNNDKSVAVIEAVWGLGELIVQGSVTPDHYEVLKRNLKIVKSEVSPQREMMVLSRRDARVSNVIKKVAAVKVKKKKLSDGQIIKLAKLGIGLQQHYFFPQDCEWAIEKGQIYLIQTRPVTSMDAVSKSQSLDGGAATKGLKLLLRGAPASPGLASGPAKIIPGIKALPQLKKGEILITEMTTPDFVPVMRKTAAIVTDRGGQTSHAAIVSRELGLPCVVGTGQATKIIKNGEIITVNGKTGEIFRGALVQSPKPETQSEKVTPDVVNRRLAANLKTATKLYVNLAEPELAEKTAAENVDGVGLLRAEFMIAQFGIHPQQLAAEKRSGEFINHLTANIYKIADAFYPRPVIYRATDFKTNEYRSLKGGDKYEPFEENPLIGYRGAMRYLAHPDIFALELKAITKVREKRNNLQLMIPFVRSPRELMEVKKLIYAAGLRRGGSFSLSMMVELPVNVLRLEEFIQVGIDGVSIGTNDLTMLILGADRDNQRVSSGYNEMDPAVLWAVKETIKKAGRRGTASSICGQAATVYPAMVKKLVRWGITSISVSPDRIEATRELIYEAERGLVNKSDN